MQITIIDKGIQKGPFPLEQVIRLLQSGEITPQDMGWTPGMPDWRPLSQFSELQVIGIELPPPPPSATVPPSSVKSARKKFSSNLLGIIPLVYGAVSSLLLLAASALAPKSWYSDTPASAEANRMLETSSHDAIFAVIGLIVIFSTILNITAIVLGIVGIAKLKKKQYSLAAVGMNCLYLIGIYFFIIARTKLVMAY